MSDLDVRLRSAASQAESAARERPLNVPKLMSRVAEIEASAGRERAFSTAGTAFAKLLEPTSTSDQGASMWRDGVRLMNRHIIHGVGPSPVQVTRSFDDFRAVMDAGLDRQILLHIDIYGYINMGMYMGMYMGVCTWAYSPV